MEALSRRFGNLVFTALLFVMLGAASTLDGVIFLSKARAQEVFLDDAEKSNEKATEDAKKVAEQIAKEAAKKAVEQTTEKAVKEAAEKAAGKAAQQAAEKAAERAAGKAAQKAAETAVAKAVEKAAEKAAEAAELKARRPDEWRGSTRVYFVVFLVDIDSIDDANQSFSANVFVRLRWQDRRLADSESPSRQVHLDQVWNPRLVLVNQTGLVSKALPDVVQVEPDGTVLYYQRYTGKLSQPLNLSNFPLDSHTFTIQFAAAGYTAEELEFVPEVTKGVTGGAMAKDISLPDWKVLKYGTASVPYHPIEAIRTASFTFYFEAERFEAYYLWQVVLPLSVVVLMSWAAFWMGRDDVGVRIGVATSSILTLIAQRFVVSNLLPRLPYMTRLDYFTVGSTLLVSLALILVVVSSYLTKYRKSDVAGRRIDLSARVVFPTAFFLLLVWFMFG